MNNHAVNNTTTSRNFKGGNSYPYRFVSRNPLTTAGKKNDYIYSFLNKKGFKFYVNCVEYNIGVYAVKFCLARHRKVPDRYKMVTNFGDPIPVLKTVVAIMLEILRKNEEASFAFIGMPRNEEDLCLTRRYCVYREFCRRYFNPISFDHLYDEDSSFYAILNKKCNTQKLLKELTALAQDELKGDNTISTVSLTRSTTI